MSLLTLPAVASATIPAGLPFADEPPPVYAGNTQLVLACVLGILAVVLLITWGKVHPFLALMLGSAVLGAVATMPPGDTVKSFVAGFGATAGAVGILIALGAMVGKLLEDSGGANRIVASMVSRVGPGGLPWVMAAIAAILGLPLFFEVGVVLLVPVVILVAQRTGVSLMKVGIPALAGLSVLHGLVPPHPGPLTAIGLLNADLGRTLIFGILIAIPTVIVAGPILARFVDQWVPKSADDLTLFGGPSKAGTRPVATGAAQARAGAGDGSEPDAGGGGVDRDPTAGGLGGTGGLGGPAARLHSAALPGLAGA
jgi:GntP family gluconate:H+ symporter